MSMPKDVSRESEDIFPGLSITTSRWIEERLVAVSGTCFGTAGSGVLNGLEAVIDTNVPFIPRFLALDAARFPTRDVPNFLIMGESC